MGRDAQAHKMLGEQRVKIDDGAIRARSVPQMVHFVKRQAVRPPAAAMFQKPYFAKGKCEAPPEGRETGLARSVAGRGATEIATNRCGTKAEEGR